MDWKCSDGSIKKISELSDQHILNAIQYLIKIGSKRGMLNLLEEQEKRQQAKVQVLCPWCGHKMRMENFVSEDPYPEVGFSLPEKYKQLVCTKCGSKGPRIEK